MSDFGEGSAIWHEHKRSKALEEQLTAAQAHIALLREAAEWGISCVPYYLRDRGDCKLTKALAIQSDDAALREYVKPLEQQRDELVNAMQLIATTPGSAAHHRIAQQVLEKVKPT